MCSLIVECIFCNFECVFRREHAKCSESHHVSLKTEAKDLSTANQRTSVKKNDVAL